MPSLIKNFHINKNDFMHAGEASIHVKNLLKSLKIHPDLIRRVAICGYEGEMNVIMHGGRGLYSVEIGEKSIILDISDDGPGIQDIYRAMQKGFSTASHEHRMMGFGSGMGLPNMKANSDKMDIQSEKGKGVRIRMLFTIPKEGEQP